MPGATEILACTDLVQPLDELPAEQKLSAVYEKLSVRSRSELARALAMEPSDP